MADSPRKIHLLLVNNHPLARAGIRACLAGAPHIEIAAEADDGGEALLHVRRHSPDVVVMDVNLPRSNGLAATARLVRESPATRVLVLTSQDHPEYLVEVIRSGARGRVSKEVTPPDLISAIEKVAAGETHFGLDETVRYLRRYLPAPSCAIAEPIRALTVREEEVLSFIGQGLSNRQIADRLAIALRTVETHRERLMRKLDIHDGVALRSYSAAHGLLAEAGKPDDVSIGN